MKRNRILRVLCGAILLLLPVLLLAGCETEPHDVHEVPATFARICHAGGTLWGNDKDGVWRSFAGSNSMEGLMQCVEAGERAVEVDFNFTSDGALACIHDWSPEYLSGIPSGVPLSREEFLESKIFWQFTPMTAEDVVKVMRAVPDLTIVTDIKDDFFPAVEALAELAPDLRDRFVIQIYEKGQYDPVREMGFDNVIFTLYRLTWNEKTDWRDLGKFARENPLFGYTFSYELCEVAGFVEGMKKSGVPLYIHTVNGEEKNDYYDMGITGIYTDDVGH